MQQKQDARSYHLPYTMQKVRRWNIFRALYTLWFAIGASFLVLKSTYIWGKPILFSSESPPVFWVMIIWIIWIICSLVALVAMVYAIFPKKLVLLSDRINYQGLFFKEERLVRDITVVQVTTKTEKANALHLEVQPPGKPLDVLLDDFRNKDQHIFLHLIDDFITEQCPHSFVDRNSIYEGYLNALPDKG